MSDVLCDLLLKLMAWTYGIVQKTFCFITDFIIDFFLFHDFYIIDSVQKTF